MGRYAIFNGLVYGGGTAVIPNPEGTPTDELHSIQIDEDIYEIVGGGGGGSQELISYDTTITTTQYGWWTAEDKDGNILDPDQYELIAVTPIVNNSPSWTGAWDGAFFINTVDGVTYRYDVSFVNINDGGYIRTSRTWNVKVVYRDKNAAGGGGGSTVVPNPQEEPTDTLNTIEIDGVVYDIESGSEGEGVEIYSEDEYIVGKWIDGKKLYQKSIKFSATSLPASWTTIEQDVDYNLVFPEVQCLYYTANGEPFTQSTRVFVQNGELKIQPLKELDLLSSTLKHVITIRYTKTVETDAPAWGGSVTNNYANFIDTSNVIDSGSYQGSFTYTATEDCFVNVAVVMSANNSATITINGELVTSAWCASLNTINPILPLKKGQTLVATASASNTSNYTVYGISYASGGSESGSSKVEYSTEERKIGKYFGEDLYEKSFIISNLTIGSNWNFDVLGTNNIEIIDFSGFCEMLINGTNDKQRFNINYYDSSNAYCKTLIDKGLDDLAIQLYSNAHSFVKARITIRYTKTTT